MLLDWRDWDATLTEVASCEHSEKFISDASIDISRLVAYGPRELGTYNVSSLRAFGFPSQSNSHLWPLVSKTVHTTATRQLPDFPQFGAHSQSMRGASQQNTTLSGPSRE